MRWVPAFAGTSANRNSMPVLYYVRHGETDFNVQARLQGRRDTVLNARGRQQAVDSGNLLRDLFARDRRAAEEFAYVASPLRRARGTTEVFVATRGVCSAPY